MDALALKFESIGLSATKAKDTTKNKKLAPILERAIDLANLPNEAYTSNKGLGNALYTLASTCTKDALNHFEFLVSQVANENLKSGDQVSGTSTSFSCWSSLRGL